MTNGDLPEGKSKIQIRETLWKPYENPMESDGNRWNVHDFPHVLVVAQHRGPHREGSSHLGRSLVSMSLES